MSTVQLREDEVEFWDRTFHAIVGKSKVCDQSLQERAVNFADASVLWRRDRLPDRRPPGGWEKER